MGKITKSIDDIILKAFKKYTIDENVIAKNFANEFKKSVNDIVPQCNTPLLDKKHYLFNEDKTMLFKKAKSRDIYKIIKSLNPRKAPGIDKIRALDLIAIGDKIVNSIKKLINVSVMQDYSKAFDTLKHDQLAERLDATGIRGPLLEWCKDYLSNRSYSVKVGDTISDAVNVNIGTAQGSPTNNPTDGKNAKVSGFVALSRNSYELIVMKLDKWMDGDPE
ncbi:uncharacterized protein LOC123659505 [Melitaea cinxia]|uniref:uncharacterized protein LOC123659505 n=1 Tax=Melitaea cinxia TaxID=113334 RepID=UPI001E273937|nr:uncharacterized protein LOC123659505 [Melitaea cinxia]